MLDDDAGLRDRPAIVHQHGKATERASSSLALDITYAWLEERLSGRTWAAGALVWALPPSLARRFSGIWE
jgi:hypothetical protein